MGRRSSGSSLTKVAFILPEALLQELDKRVEEGGYASRSEALRRGVRLVLNEGFLHA